MNRKDTQLLVENWRILMQEGYEIKEKKEKEAYMLRMLKSDSYAIVDALNDACGQVKLRKKSNTEFYVSDDEIIEKAMESEALSPYFRESMGVKDSLGREDIENVKGVLRLILKGCSEGKKNACTIEVEDVERVTDGIESYKDIGM